jgi:dolichyl-phosphate beta-glucosyltransferase
MDLSLIIPAYNEEKRIGLTLERTVDYLGRQPWTSEVLVVDDGSADATAIRVGEWADATVPVRLVSNPGNRGKGYSIRHGLAEATGRFAGFMDADYKTEISALDEAMRCLEGECDMVIGDRSLGSSQIEVQRRAYRQLGSHLFKAVFLRLMGLDGIGDTQCGFKFFKIAAMRDIFFEQKVDGYMFDVETLLIARKKGYRICSIGVEWRFDADSRFNPVTGMVRNLVELARIRWIHR